MGILAFIIIWTTALTTILLVLAGKMSKIQIFNDGIFVEDFMYPVFIPNDAIKSIKLGYKLPSILMRTNGYGGLKMWKGFYRIKEGRKRVILYLEDHNKVPFIEIQTTKDTYFVNFKNVEQTMQLYDEMTSAVKLVDESRLIDFKGISPIRSIIVVVIFTIVIMVPILIVPLLLS